MLDTHFLISYSHKHNPVTFNTNPKQYLMGKTYCKIEEFIEEYSSRRQDWGMKGADSTAKVIFLSFEDGEEDDIN